MKVQEKSPVHAGMEMSQSNDFSVQLAHGDFANALKPMPTTPELRASRQRPLSIEEVRIRECRLGELRWLATDSRPHIRALLDGEIFRIHDSVRTVEGWRRATIPNYVSSSHCS